MGMAIGLGLGLGLGESVFEVERDRSRSRAAEQTCDREPPARRANFGLSYRSASNGLVRIG